MFVSNDHEPAAIARLASTYTACTRVWKCWTAQTERESGFSAEIEFQRRSGDASIFFGNTLVNHCAAMAIYAYENLCAGLFAGDDAVLFGTGIILMRRGVR